MITETYNTSGEPVDYQDRMAKRMMDYDYQSAYDNSYLEGLRTGIAQGKRETIKDMLEIIDKHMTVEQEVEEGVFTKFNTFMLCVLKTEIEALKEKK